MKFDKNTMFGYVLKKNSTRPRFTMDFGPVFLAFFSFTLITCPGNLLLKCHLIVSYKHNQNKREDNELRIDFILCL